MEDAWPDRNEAPLPLNDAVLPHRSAELLIPCDRVISLHSRQVRAPVLPRPERGLMTGVPRRVGLNRVADVASASRTDVRRDDLPTRVGG